MAQTIDFYIDVTSGQLVAAGSSYLGVVPTLTRNDSYNFRVRLQERDSVGILRDISTNGISLKLGIGEVDDGPSDGQFKLVLNSTTSNAISYNATTAQVFNAISSIAAGATVATYGNDPYSYLITSATQNTAMSFGGDSFTLFPTSSVLVSTRRLPKANVSAQQIIQLRRNPAVYSDVFTPSSTAGIVSLSQIQNGGPAKNESFLLKIGRDAIGGGVVLNYGSNSTTAVPVGSSAASFTEALQAVTGIGVGNISVDSSSESGEYTISFVKALGNINITTGFTLDSSGVLFANFIESTVTMATSELDELFAEAGTDTITPTIEIEVTQNGKSSTVYQSQISVRRDLITAGSVVPASQASYYTKSETDNLFIKQDSNNIDATNRQLNDSLGFVSVDYGSYILKDPSNISSIDWGNRILRNENGTQVIDYQAGTFSDGDGNQVIQLGPDELRLSQDEIVINGTSFITVSAPQVGFFGEYSSQPTSGSVVSALINYGFLKSSTTYGILPLSNKTITTTASLNFGSLAAHDTGYQNVTITGSNINDIVMIGLPNTVCYGLVYFGHVISANTVCIGVSNTDNQAVNSATQTFRISVIGF